MPEDADAAKGLISTTSPIGRAFLNKEPGDSVKVDTPGGKREFEIVKLFTIHDEAAGGAGARPRLPSPPPHSPSRARARPAGITTACLPRCAPPPPSSTP